MFVFKPLRNLSVLHLNANLDIENDRYECNYSDIAIGYLTNLKVLSIDLCNNSFFGKGYRNLKQLTTISFDSCMASSLTNVTFKNFELSNIKQLELTNCDSYESLLDIEANILSPFKMLKILDISNSAFSLKHSLKLLYPYRNQKLDIINFHNVSFSKHNQYLVTLTKEMTKYLTSMCVKTLILSYNGIVDFHSQTIFAFRGHYSRCLENLVLSGNSFSFGYTVQHMFEFMIFLKTATKLSLFDYSYIPVKYPDMQFLHSSHFYPRVQHDIPSNSTRLSDGSKTCLTIYLPVNLHTLRMTHIMTERVDTKSIKFRNLKQLKYVDLSYINIGHMPNIVLDEAMNLTFLDLSGIDLSVVSGQHAHNVSMLVLQNTNLDFILNQNKDVLGFFKNIKSLNIASNHIVYIPQTCFLSMDILETLNISCNSLYTVPDSLVSPRLHTLDIRYNRLSSLEQWFMDWVDRHHQQINGNFTLFLKGNNFYCSCENLDFIIWLTKTVVHIDSDGNYICRLVNGTISDTKKVMSNFHDLFHSCSATVWLTFGVISIFSSFFLIGISAVLHQYRWKIANIFYRHLKKKCEGDTIDLECKYDVFVAYSSDSLRWLRSTFVPMMQEEWSLNLCLKDRDFPIGANKSDTITTYMKNSKHFIFILTPQFITRKWGEFEIDIAKYEMFHHRQHKKIIIVLKDGTRPKSVPNQFHLIWKDICLVEWPEQGDDTPSFWYNLKLQLEI
jgi:Leucine-rich repeat (LRR) protein